MPARALARSRAYGLLGDLFLDGLDARSLLAWRQVDGGVLADPAAPVDLEAAAEAHARLVLIGLPPYEGAFLAADGLLGGDTTAAVRTDRALAGLGDPPGHEPDHVGSELAWLAFLSGAEADAKRDGVDPERILALQRGALDDHLLRWVPQWVTHLRGLPTRGDADSVYVRGAELALAVLTEHRGSLGDRALPGRPASGWDLPPAAPVLEDPRAGLRAIAEHLCVPCQCGGYLARDTIAAIGRSLDLPMTFGARPDLLEGLFCAAAQYGRVPEVCTALDQLLAGWSDAWTSPWSAPWVERAGITRAMLARVAAAARELPT